MTNTADHSQITPPTALDIFATIDREREHLTGERPATVWPKSCDFPPDSAGWAEHVAYCAMIH